MSWFHSHEWEMWGNKRLELHGKTFMVSIWTCRGRKCREIKSTAADMQPYLDMLGEE